MYIIEPCCAERQMSILRDAIKKGGTKEIEGYGDLSLTELLPAIMTRYYETEMMIVAPSVPDQAAEIIATWMRRTIARMDGKGRMNYISHLTIVGDLSPEQSPMVSEWLKDNAFGERLTLVSKPQTETAILMPDFAITGPVNMRYGRHFIATATSEAAKVEALWKRFGKLTEPEPEKQETPQEESQLTDKTQEAAGTDSAARPLRAGRMSRMLK